jgi:hypothetical protein
MNKFDDLLYHSGLTADGSFDQMDQYDQDAIELFGKLIVYACMSACLEDVADPQASELEINCVKRIQKKFGL